MMYSRFVFFLFPGLLIKTGWTWIVLKLAMTQDVGNKFSLVILALEVRQNSEDWQL